MILASAVGNTLLLLYDIGIAPVMLELICLTRPFCLVKVKMKRVHPLGSTKYFNVLAPRFILAAGSGFIDINIACVPVLQLKLLA